MATTTTNPMKELGDNDWSNSNNNYNAGVLVSVKNNIKRLTLLTGIILMLMLSTFVNNFAIINNHTKSDDNCKLTELSPDVSISDSQHVLNLVEFESMTDEDKDDIFNNLESIVVTDGDIGSSRHQINKVTWSFDEDDSMILYSGSGDIFMLSNNGTISSYDDISGARRLLSIEAGWLEGKMKDVVRRGDEYKRMTKEGKPYLKTRKLTRELISVNNEMVDCHMLKFDHICFHIH